MKPLVLSYELSWRTREDEAFSRSQAWKDIRTRVLRREDFTCSYCGLKSEKGMQVNHIDGNPKNHVDENLEVICPSCHMILHSGLWAKVRGILLLFKKSGFSQNDIVRITREMRLAGKADDDIIQHLGLRERVPWKQDLDYLSHLYGFISSKQYLPTPKPLLSEWEQKDRIVNKESW
ncbi:MAG TPA: HNH endonuclease [Nitrososphaerales archaeon]|nr:HNH endonuclease [Nitrososphaerales archaeon]